MSITGLTRQATVRRRITRAALALSTALTLCLIDVVTPLTPASATPSGGGFVQECGGTSWWAGTTNVCNGAVVYRDYVNDDHGADTGGLGYQGTQNAFGTLAHPAGDQRYAADRISVADLVHLTLSRRGNQVDVVAETAALYRPGDAVLTLAIDTDGRTTTGGGAWGALGVRSAGWDRLVVINRGDPKTNTLRGSFPLPTSSRWRIQAVTSDASTGTVMNVAFRGVDEQAQYNLSYTNASPYPPSGRGAWFEDKQAAALASGDISGFGYTVSTADLRAGVTRKAAIGPGLHERVYTSSYTVPAESGPPTESMSYVGVKGRGDGGAAPAFAQVFNLLGKYQPYGVYVPRSRTNGRFPVQMEWHGSNQGIVAQINQAGMQQQFGENLGRLLITPEARGPNGYGSDVSERDLLDVMADVARTFPVDTDRVFSSGYSQGGYITFRMAMLYPEAFAGFTGWVPFTGDDTNGLPGQGTGGGVTAGAVGNMVDFAGNARHVPGSMLFGAADELVPASSAEAMREAFRAAGGSFRWWMHTAADHFTFALADDWRKEAAYSAGQRRVHDPARVTYRTATFLDSPQYGIRHDWAYWVSRIRPRADGYADTDLTSSGCGAPVVTATDAPGAGPDPVPYVQDGRDVTVTRGPAAARLEGTLANVAQLRLDVRRACLPGAFTYAITSDGPATVTLSDGRVLTLRAGANTGTLPAR